MKNGNGNTVKQYKKGITTSDSRTMPMSSSHTSHSTCNNKTNKAPSKASSKSKGY